MFSEKSKLLKKLNIMHFSSLDSTSTYLKKLAENGAPSGTVVIADTQSGGRGRMGRSFLSKKGGLYMSVLLRPNLDLNYVSNSCITNITPLAAVAVSEAIESISGKQIDIKWVNDLFFQGKKVCGILAEGSLDYIVLGIGINLTQNFADTELFDIATALYTDLEKNAYDALKKRLVNEILKKLLCRYEFELANGDFFEQYRSRLFIIGRRVKVLQGENEKNATVIDLNRDFTLLVRYDDESISSLNSGEISLKVQNEA